MTMKSFDAYVALLIAVLLIVISGLIYLFTNVVFDDSKEQSRIESVCTYCVFYTESNIDTLSYKCYDYSLTSYRGSNMLQLDTDNGWKVVETTTAPIKVIRFKKYERH